MDFKNRPASNVKTLHTTITFYEVNGQVNLEFDIKGFNEVPVTIELCFNNGGTLTGTTPIDHGVAFLEAGNAIYTKNGSAIEFGPGNKGHKNITGLEGERYSTHFGSLKTDGQHVYITGKTPFKHLLTFK
jgi:hypothetical protein